MGSSRRSLGLLRNAVARGGRAWCSSSRRLLASVSDSEFSGLDVTGDRNVDIFDRALKSKQRDRAAWLMRDSDPVLDTVTENLIDRLQDCKRTFPKALNLGGAFDAVRRLLQGRGGIQELISMDISEDMIRRSMIKAAEDETAGRMGSMQNFHLVGDEEYLPLQPNSLDLVISSLGLHWVNDLPGAMSQCRTALKPDGLFLATMFGGETLRELRISCTVAQMELEGGVSPRVSPLAEVRDAGNLLTRAGFALPTVDVDEITVRYPSAIELIEHLRSMGETNAVRERMLTVKRDTALRTAAVYQEMFGESDGTIPATYQVIYMAGWSPDVSQQRPKRRGSATVSFDDLHKAFTPEASKKSPDDGPGGNLKQEVPTEDKEEPGTGDSKPETDGTTTRLPSGTWYKIE
ncbi:hypothetical protein M758_1G273200 [Ceratodon purpureus]|nr:hypothetical protein M758_1G273200 [Ceratodon purpureus]